MREFVSNYRFVLVLAGVALGGTLAVYAISLLNINRSQDVGAKQARTQSQRESSLRNSVSPPTALTENKTVTYRGISFTYSGSLASEVKAESEPAYALQSKTDTGQGVAPEHIVFTFVGDYSSQHESSTFSPKIIVYPIGEYKKALGRSENYVRQFEAKIETLKRILSEEPNPWEKEIPFLPFGIGASQSFHARTKYVNFRNGKGALFLTQYNIEPSLINNQGLTYTFQGLTDDNVYYVSATFPVTVSTLPPDYDAESTEGYTLVPPRSFRGPEYESFENDYRKYLTKVIEKLEKLPPDSYQPNLEVIEDLIRSLTVAREDSAEHHTR